MATTYQDQLVALNALTNSLVFENTVGAITGTNHNLQEIGQNTSVYDNLVAYDNYTYKVVRTYGTNSANGQSLRDAYEDAKTLTPGGLPLSITNRVALLIPPGTYALGTSGLEVDTQFIDFIGLGRADETIITSLSNTGTGLGTITQTTNDVKFRNITLQNDANTYVSADSTDDSAYAPQGVYPSVEFTDCIFKNPAVAQGAPFMRLDTEYSGNFIRCRGVDATGNSIFFPIASGFYFDCHYAGNGFGYNYEASGIFSDCSCQDGFGFNADASGSFTRCTAFNSGFGSNGNASGNFNYCTALTESFGYGAAVACSGKFNNCKATDFSFGLSTSTAEFTSCSGVEGCFGSGFTGGALAGTYIDCTGQYDCFGHGAGTNLTGTFIQCNVVQYNGFGLQASTLSGTFINCFCGNAGFSDSGTLSGKFENCSCGDFGFLYGGTGSLSGTFTNCSSGTDSFGSSSTGWSSLEISGSFFNCKAGDRSFGYTIGGDMLIDISGKLVNCVAGSRSFGGVASTPFTGSHTEEISGYLENCHAGPNSFASTATGSKTGTLVNCSVRPDGVATPLADEGPLSGTMQNCSWLAPEAGEAALIVEDGAKVYGGIYRAGSGATASITSSGAVTASIANVLVNVALGGSITNNISSPNVIVDSDV